jgi:sialic acid synthase SpsE
MRYEKIRQAVAAKSGQDIFIIGKGSSIDEIDLSLLEGRIVINTNDSELVFPGDIAVFHNEWVLDIFDKATPKCKLYISDKSIPGEVAQIYEEYVPYTPESADFLLTRFFSERIYIEHAILVTALRVANEIALYEGERKNVFLLGFDFSTSGGFTSKIAFANLHDDQDYAERVISSQEPLLQMIMEEKSRLSINIRHVGNKLSSFYTPEAFNKLFGSRITDVRKDDICILGSSMLEHNESNKKQHNYKVKIVAEITTNHFGDMDRLKAMITAAKKAGADYVKLQKRNVESFYSAEQLMAPYESPFGKTFRDYRHGIELNQAQFEFVDKFCKDVGIGWFASILDMQSYEFIRQFDPEIIKLPSTISEHKGYLTAVAQDFKNDVVISTGYTEKSYEDFIFSTFANVRNIYLLQCTSAYPTRNEDAQIGVVRHYYNLSKQNSLITPGFSSHDIGSLCSMLAVASGAQMIEKHVKFGHVIWSNFDEVAVDLVNGDFDRFVADVRRAEMIVGDEHKVVNESEHHKYWCNP